MFEIMALVVRHVAPDRALDTKYLSLIQIGIKLYTVMCLSIGTHKNNKFSICTKFMENL